jgi:hypothetical protein
VYWDKEMKLEENGKFLKLGLRPCGCFFSGWNNSVGFLFVDLCYFSQNKLVAACGTCK